MNLEICSAFIKSDIMLELIKNKKIHALYFNFPFCRYPCTYCHYVNNLSFGYYDIPNEYIKLLVNQLKVVLDKIDYSSVECIYFGGGTASLLNDSQVEEIQRVIENYDMPLKEVTIELHPNACNFDYINNRWFTRYSIGIQTLDSYKAQLYRRNDYSSEDIDRIIKSARCIKSRKINLDFIFDNDVSILDIEYVNKYLPDSVTFYPNTNGRGVERLQSVLSSFLKLKNLLYNYHEIGKNPFIFFREQEQPTRYSEIEYIDYKNIIGIGHNCFSLVDEKSFLSQYDDHTFAYIERHRGLNRVLITLFSSIAFGVKMKAIKEYLPELISEKILYTVCGEYLVGEKHTRVIDDDLVYLPPIEYIRFYQEFIQLNYFEYSQYFKQSIGYGDDDFKVLEQVYNRTNTINQKQIKKKTPKVRILIEGIDGSGKDTFAKLLVEELKMRFYYAVDSRISIVGQPDSDSIYGLEVKSFVEDLQCNVSENCIRHMLKENRLASEKKFEDLPGILIMIRGLATDKGTYNYIFNKNVDLGEGQIIRYWDIFIVIDIDSNIADKRIENRGIPRTWRESIENLSYFRQFFLQFDSNIFFKKMVIYNNTLEELRKKAVELADYIYDTY